MIWIVETTEHENRETSLIIFKDEKELGIFLQNYDKVKYSIDSIAGTYSDRIKSSDMFIKKEENLETGIKEES